MKKLLTYLVIAAVFITSALPVWATDDAQKNIEEIAVVEAVSSDESENVREDQISVSQSVAKAEEEPDQTAADIGRKGSVRTLIFSGCLIGFGGLTVVIANKKTKGKKAN